MRFAAATGQGRVTIQVSGFPRDECASASMVREIDTICRAKKVKRLGLTIAVNHVHLCARLRPDQSPAQLMRWIKSTTSKNAFEHFPQFAARFGSNQLWGSGYHVESLGDKNVFAILAYFGRQDEKHDLRAFEGYLATIDTFLRKADEDELGEKENR
jgi:REP element-mobilizing transposase RayT